MLDCGLMTIGTNPMGRPAAFFTETRPEGLRLLLQDRRVMGPELFGSLRLKLGVSDHQPMEGEAAAPDGHCDCRRGRGR
jgi:hypothetical protein